MLSWTPEFETGRPRLDAQHQMLFIYINRLGSHLTITNPTVQDIESVLHCIGFLENYVTAHFSEEEECMDRCRCPAHLANKKAHAEFMGFFKRFKRRLDHEGQRPEALRELHEACQLWIQTHIMNIDLQLRGCPE